eukprot:Polyplicarium_translucidae@DN2530_c0_g2_i1.p2
MKFLLALVSFAAILGSCGPLVALNAETFTSVTGIGVGSADHEDWFIKFYVPWCPHCKKIEKVWKDVAKELEGEVYVGAVDCTSNDLLKTKFAVRGYPTILYMHGGKSYKYAGNRSLDDFVDFARGGHLKESSNISPLPILAQ